MGKGPTQRQGQKSRLRTAGDSERKTVIATQGLGAWRQPASVFKSVFKDGHDRARQPKHKKRERQQWAGE